MVEHLSMNTVAHAAIRRTLTRFEGALAAFPVGSQARADQLDRAWKFFDQELHHHHHLEEEYFWPALRETDADLTGIEDLDREHDDMRAALVTATGAMAALQAAPTEQALEAARTAVSRLSQVLLGHLDHEERDLEPISAAYQQSEPMKAALKKVKKDHVRGMGNTLEWLQDGADASDRAGLRKFIPPPVVFLFTRVAGGRYRREIASIWTGEEATVAAPIVVAPDARPTPLDLVGEDMTVLASGTQTGSYEIFLQVGREGSGPPPHHHPWDEAFYVLRGEVQFGADGEESTVRPGTLVHIPGGTTHWFKMGPGGAEMLSITSKAGAADFFSAISRDADGNVPGLEDVIRIAAEHDATIVLPTS